MCIVIDVNAIPSVFNPSASNHCEFRPILDWVDNHKIKIVYGGTKYKEELANMPKYLSILSEMRRMGKIHEADDVSVDTEQKRIEQMIRRKSFNDQVIVAIVIVSRCTLICSNDKKSFPFLTLKTLYPKGFKRPSIYTGRRNRGLLKRKHVSGRCGPCSSC